MRRTGALPFLLAAAGLASEASGQCEVGFLLDDVGQHGGFARSVQIGPDDLFVCASSHANYSGGVVHFERTPLGWRRSGVLQHEPPIPAYGIIMALDGSTLLVSGLLFTIAGVHVWEKTDGVWTRTGELLTSDGVPASSVAIDGDLAVIGSTRGQGRSTGAVYVFERRPDGWTQTARFITDKTKQNLFGQSVAVDGDTFVVGDEFMGSARGAAWVFERAGDGWTRAKLQPASSHSGQRLGASVDVEQDRVLVGSWGDRSAFVFRREAGGWVEEAELRSPSPYGGHVVALEDGRALVSGSERVLVFERRGDTWTETRSLEDHDGPDTGSPFSLYFEGFGRSFDAYGETVAVCAPRDNAAYFRGGSLYLFTAGFTPGLSLEVTSPAVVDEPVTFTVGGADPGSRVVFLAGTGLELDDPLPCGSMGRIVLDEPHPLGEAVADESGTAMLRRSIPGAAAGLRFAVQALVPETCAVSCPVPLVPLQRTTVIGALEDEAGDPVAGVSVGLLDQDVETRSGGHGRFVLECVLAVPEGVRVLARTRGLRGATDFLAPVGGGVTDAGTVRVSRARPEVLVVWDYPGHPRIDELKSALEASGLTVRLADAREDRYDGTNPPLEPFDAVLHINAHTADIALPPETQRLMVDFVQRGGGYVHDGRTAFDVHLGKSPWLRPLTLVVSLEGVYQENQTVTYSVVNEVRGHPVLQQVPSTFTFSYPVFAVPAPAQEFLLQPSTVLMRTPDGTAAVVAREYGAGRVVGFANADNIGGIKLPSDANETSLVVNAMHWVLGSTPGF